MIWFIDSRGCVAKFDQISYVMRFSSPFHVFKTSDAIHFQTIAFHFWNKLHKRPTFFANFFFFACILRFHPWLCLASFFKISASYHSTDIMRSCQALWYLNFISLGDWRCAAFSSHSWMFGQRHTKNWLFIFRVRSHYPLMAMKMKRLALVEENQSRYDM